MRTILFSILLAVPLTAPAQLQPPLTLTECYTLAEQNYPLAKQRELLVKSRDYSISNASKGYLPQLSINGQATYQSDVTQIPIALPNMTIPTPDKDQYRIYGEINQPLTDLFIIGEQKHYTETNTAIEAQKLDVELYKLKERINQLYFGILLLDEQRAQADLLQKDIRSGIEKAEAGVKNEIALQTNADVLNAELLKTDQRLIELNAARKAYLEMLGLFINRTLDENTQLARPAGVAAAPTINRPELVIYERQRKSISVQNRLLTARTFPRVNLFFQAGYGKPAFNIFSNSFDFYYIGGIRLGWSFTNFYTLRNDRRMLDINMQMIDVQQETFLFNTNVALRQQGSEIGKLQELIAKDKAIIALRANIKNVAKSQLENGVITASDYLREVNAEDQARQNLALHEVQLLLAQYSYQVTSGN